MKKVLLLLLLAPTLFLTSCATIISPQGEKNIPVSSNVSDFEVFVNGQNLGMASTILVKKGDIITVKKDGYSTSSTMIQGKFNGWVIGNLVFGGIIGIIVDAATGNINKVTTQGVHAKLAVRKEKM